MIERLFETPLSDKEGGKTVESIEMAEKGRDVPENLPVDETVEGDKALRACANCGKQFWGDSKTVRPICPECAQAPYRPQQAPL